MKTKEWPDLQGNKPHYLDKWTKQETLIKQQLRQQQQ